MGVFQQAAKDPAPLSAKQTIDLLALTDPVKDRVTDPRYTGANRWSRGANGALIYSSDGKAGKLDPPLSLKATSYEIELGFRRTSGKGKLCIDLPLDGHPTVVTLIVDAATEKLINNRAGPVWPAGTVANGTVTLRCDTMPDGQMKVSAKLDGRPIGEWSGAPNPFGGKTFPHPDFPGAFVTSLASIRDSYEFTKWELRVFEGEAKVLRGAAASIPSDGSWLDVIPQVQLPRDFNQRQPGRKDAAWWAENGALKAEQSGDCGIVSPDLVLPDSYELSLRVKAAIRDDGTWRSATVHVPVGEDRHLTVHLGLNYPPSKINATVFEQIGGKAAETGSPSIKPMALKTDVEQLVEIAVRRDG